jgi:hypothetical protein
MVVTYQPLWLFQTAVGDHDRAMSIVGIERFTMATIASQELSVDGYER